MPLHQIVKRKFDELKLNSADIDALYANLTEDNTFAFPISNNEFKKKAICNDIAKKLAKDAEILENLIIYNLMQARKEEAEKAAASSHSSSLGGQQFDFENIPQQVKKLEDSAAIHAEINRLFDAIKKQDKEIEKLYKTIEENSKEQLQDEQEVYETEQAIEEIKAQAQQPAITPDSPFKIEPEIKPVKTAELVEKFDQKVIYTGKAETPNPAPTFTPEVTERLFALEQKRSAAQRKIQEKEAINVVNIRKLFHAIDTRQSLAFQVQIIKKTHQLPSVYDIPNGPQILHSILKDMMTPRQHRKDEDDQRLNYLRDQVGYSLRNMLKAETSHSFSKSG